MLKSLLANKNHAVLHLTFRDLPKFILIIKIVEDLLEEKEIGKLILMVTQAKKMDTLIHHSNVLRIQDLYQPIFII